MLDHKQHLTGLLFNKDVAEACPSNVEYVSVDQHAFLRFPATCDGLKALYIGLGTHGKE